MVEFSALGQAQGMWGMNLQFDACGQVSVDNTGVVNVETTERTERVTAALL